MTIETTSVRDAEDPKPKRYRHWRLLAALLGGAVLAAAIGWGLWLWLPARMPDPPVADLASAEPVVAEAIEAARTSVTANRRSAAAWGHLGMVLHVHDYLPEAGRCYAQAVKLDSGDPRWPYLQALTQLKDPLTSGAGLRSLERAVEQSGDVPAPRLRLGEALLEQGRLDEAEGHFRRVLERDPKNPRALLGLGQVAHFRGDLKASLAHLTRSALYAPNLLATHALLAEVHHRLGDDRAAEDERRRLAQSTDDPRWPDPYFEEAQRCAVGVLPEIDRANVLFQRGRGPEAVKMMQQTMARHPDSLLAYLALGRFCNQLGDAAAAERALREAVRRQPDAFEAQFELGIALQIQGRNDAAAGCFRQAVALKPDYAPAHYQLAHCLLRQGDRAGAEAAFRAGVRYRPNFAACHRDLGFLCAENGAVALAMVHLQQAIRLNPTDPQAKRLLERLLKQIPFPG
jgi:tetratricopeptide (TPR) repeat protein